jgi:hypothetical protein
MADTEPPFRPKDGASGIAIELPGREFVYTMSGPPLNYIYSYD